MAYYSYVVFCFIGGFFMFCSRMNSFDKCSDCYKKYVVFAETTFCEDVYFCFYEFYSKNGIFI